MVFDQLGADAGAAGGKRVGPQQERGADDLGREGIASAGGVGAEEIDLELADLLGGDGAVAEGAETRGNAVGGGAGLDDPLNDGAAGPHPLACGVVETGQLSLASEARRHRARAWRRRR